MKLNLGPKQVEFLKELLEGKIFEQQQFFDEQLGDGGPSNQRTAFRNMRWAQRQIKESQQLLAKIEKQEEEK